MRIVRTFSVTSSPTRPSPRVAAWTSAPSTVGDGERQPVDLGLDGEAQRLGVDGEALRRRARLHWRSSVDVKDVVEAQHRLGVHDRREDVVEIAAPTVAVTESSSRSSGCSASSARSSRDQRVVVGVGDGRRVAARSTPRCGAAISARSSATRSAGFTTPTTIAAPSTTVGLVDAVQHDGLARRRPGARARAGPAATAPSWRSVAGWAGRARCTGRGPSRRRPARRART